MRSGSTRRGFLGMLGTAVGVSVADPVARSRGKTVNQSDDNWPEFGYDAANTGYNPGGVGATEDVGGVWTHQTGGRITASPVVSDGVVYVGSQDRRLYALDAQTGEEQSQWPVELDSEIQAAPIVADGIVYVGDQSGVVYALDADTGDEQWTFETEGSIYAPPALAGETVYIGSQDGSLYAVDTEAGTERWSYDTGSSIESGPAIAQPDADEQEQFLYVGSDNATLYAFDISDDRPEEPAWTFNALGPVRSSPAVANGTVYVGSLVENERGAGALYAVDAETGSGKWDFDTDGAVVGSPAVADGTVYIGSRSQAQNLFAVDAESGDEKWAFDTEWVVTSAPAVVDGAVYVTSESRIAFGLDTDGSELWSFETNGSIAASPAVANGTVYIGSDDTTLYALETGGEMESEAGGDDNQTFERDDEENRYAFLAVPAVIGGFFTILAGIAYAVFRSDWAKGFAVEEPPIEKLYEDEDEPIPDYDSRTESTVWSAIVDDVIGRADGSEKTATENVIVTAYADLETLDSPVVAYEIESARDNPAQIHLTEPVIDEERADEKLTEQPLNEGWSLSDGELTFETVVEPGKTVKTMVGRLDCPTDQSEKLVGKPDVTVEGLGEKSTETNES